MKTLIKLQDAITASERRLLNRLAEKQDVESLSLFGDITTARTNYEMYLLKKKTERIETLSFPGKVLTKEMFCAAINAIKLQQEQDEINSKKLGKIYINAFPANLIYDNSILSEMIILLLKELTDDKFNDINYFIYELDFGKHGDGAITTENGEQIDLSSPEKLFDYLMK